MGNPGFWTLDSTAWASDDPDLCHQKVSLDHNDLIVCIMDSILNRYWASYDEVHQKIFSSFIPLCLCETIIPVLVPEAAPF